MVLITFTYFLSEKTRKTEKFLIKLVKDQVTKKKLIKENKIFPLSYLNMSCTYYQFEIMKIGDKVMVWVSFELG